MATAQEIRVKLQAGAKPTEGQGGLAAGCGPCPQKPKQLRRPRVFSYLPNPVAEKNAPVAPAGGWSLRRVRSR